MAEHDREMVNPEVHHEEKDVNIRAILWFVVIFIAFTIVTYISLGFLFDLFKKQEQKEQAGPVTMVRGAKPEVAPEPRLQPFGGYGQKGALNTPAADMKKMRTEEEADLISYGWVERQKGIVRIPIAQAIDIIAQQGLPVRQVPVVAGPNAAPASQSSVPIGQPAVTPSAESAPGQARSTSK